MGRTPVLPVRAALVRAPAGIFAVKSAGTLSAPFITVGRNYIGHFENSSPKTGNFKVQPWNIDKKVAKIKDPLNSV